MNGLGLFSLELWRLSGDFIDVYTRAIDRKDNKNLISQTQIFFP